MQKLYLILTIFNSIVYLYNAIKVAIIYSTTPTFKKIFKVGYDAGEKILEEHKDKDDSFKIGLIIGMFIVALLFMSPILFTIIFALSKGMTTGLIIFVISELAISLLVFYMKMRNPNHTIKDITRSGLITIFKFQVLLMLFFGINFDLRNSIVTVYQSDLYLSNTLTILMPIIYSSTMILTIYFGFLGSKTLFFPDKSEGKNIRYSSILVIFVLSSFIGLIYLFEGDIAIDNNRSFDLILNVLMVVLGSILIPSVLSLIKDKDQKGKEDITNE